MKDCSPRCNPARPDQLPTGATEGVFVGEVLVYRAGSCGWHLQPADQDALWAQVLREHPTQPGERVLQGCTAGRTTAYTRAQSDAFRAHVQRLIRAARKSTQPGRDTRRAGRAAQASFLLATAFGGLLSQDPA